jgi:hypothetical protein
LAFVRLSDDGVYLFRETDAGVREVFYVNPAAVPQPAKEPGR